MTTPNPKKRIMTKMVLNEISAVDRPAQSDALAVFMKRAPVESGADRAVYAPLAKSAGDIGFGLDDVIGQALGVARGDWHPLYDRASYDAAMVDLAKREAKQGETADQAMARLAKANDPRCAALSEAARCADLEADLATARAEIENESMAKALGDREATWQEIWSLVQERQLPGESMDRAFERLSRDDDEVLKLINRYNGNRVDPPQPAAEVVRQARGETNAAVSAAEHQRRARE